MIHLYHLVSSDAPVHIDYARTPCDSPGVLKKARFHGTLRLPAKCTVLLIITIMLFTGCATPDTSESQRKTAEELGTKERKEKEEAAKRQIDGEIFLIAMENSRSIRERAYCAPSPEALGELYALLNAGDSERASAVAELVGADILKPRRGFWS